MITVSLIGIDGVGKTTVAQKVAADFPYPIKYLYMGRNVAASNHSLPTTRWWRSRRKPHTATARVNGQRRPSVLRSLRKSAGFVNGVAEEVYRASVVARCRKRGEVVLLDRHFVLDYYHEDHGPHRHERPLKRRLQGLVRQRVHPMPDLVICLDLPGDAAYARKREFSPEFLDARRREYLNLRAVVPQFAVVDASRELDAVVADVRELILTAYGRKKHGKPTS